MRSGPVSWGGHVAMVYCSRLQLAAPTGRSPFAALPLDTPSIGAGTHPPLASPGGAPPMVYGHRNMSLGGGGGDGHSAALRVVAGNSPVPRAYLLLQKMVRGWPSAASS